MGEHKGYLNVGFYDDGRPGEIFINMSKEGSTLGGLMDAIAALTSISLQSGVPLQQLVHKFAYTRFEPNGHSGNSDIGYAHSLIDYIFRWLGHQFVPDYNPNDEQKPLVNEK